MPRRSSPASTTDSLFARATRFPAESAATVGLSPIPPTTAFTTTSTPSSAASAARASSPSSTSPPFQALRARRAASGSTSAILGTRGLKATVQGALEEIVAREARLRLLERLRTMDSLDLNDAEVMAQG